MIKSRHDDRRGSDRRNNEYKNESKDLKVAEIAGVSPSIAKIWRKAGVLPCVKESPACEDSYVRFLCFRQGGKP